MPSVLRRLPLATLLLLAALLLGLVPAAPANAATHVNGVRLSAYEARLVSLVNAARTARGLRALIVTPGTTDMARDWSHRQASNGAMSHRPSLRDVAVYGSPSWRMVTENVGWRSNGDAKAMFDAYMNSPGHRANILDSRPRYLGIGAVGRVQVKDGVSRYLTYNTMNFTDSYTTTYGRTRTPAWGLRYEGKAYLAATHLGTFEFGSDQRLRSAGAPGISATAPRVDVPTSGDDAVRTTFKATTTTPSGAGQLHLRDSMLLTTTASLTVKLSARTPTGAPVRVQVLVQEPWGPGPVSLGWVSVRGNGVATTVKLPLPASAKVFRNHLTLAVPASSLNALGTQLSQRSVTLALHQATVNVA